MRFSRIALFVLACGALVSAQSPKQLPAPFATPSADNRSQVIPQPDGFDSGFDLLTTLTVPARSTVDFSPDGFIYLDRDCGAVPLIGLRFNSNAPFSVAGERVTLSPFGIVLTRSPLLVRDFDDAE